MSSYILQTKMHNGFQQKDILGLINRIFKSDSFMFHSIRFYENFNPSVNEDEQKTNIGHFIILQSKSQAQKLLLKIRKIEVFTTKNKQTSAQNTLYNTTQHTLSCEVPLTQSCHTTFLSHIKTTSLLPKDPTIAFILLQSPLQLYFVTQKSPQAIKLILQKQYKLCSVVGYFSFQSNDQQRNKQPYQLFVQGYDQQAKKDIIIILNLMTFQIKQVVFQQENKSNNKDKKAITKSLPYYPQSNPKSFRMFHDDRLYVFADHQQQLSTQQKSKNNTNQSEELLWSFDLEKGYWFALQMKCQNKFENYKTNNSTQYDSGKVIVFNDNHFQLLELYQCKLTKLITRSQSSLIESEIQSKKQLKGLFCIQKHIFTYYQEQISSEWMQLKKIKPMPKVIKSQI